MKIGVDVDDDFDSFVVSGGFALGGLAAVYIQENVGMFIEAWASEWSPPKRRMSSVM